jgi:prepilin-type N-terminal cleavage/methylation domain-containing protein
MTMSRRRHRQRGYTLIEIMIVLVISTMLMILAFDLIESATRTSLFVESHNNLSQWAQRPLNFMQSEVYQNKAIFDAGTIGTGYLTRFTTPPGYPGAWPSCGAGGCGGPAATVPALPVMKTDSLLPLQDASNVIAPDAGTGTQRFTGNVLFLVRQLPPILIPYDHDNNVNTPNINFPADRYRFELYYLCDDTTRPFSTASYFVDLVRARSIDFADYFQLNPLIGTGGSFTAAQKTAIINGLTTNNLRVAWDPMNKPVDTAFYKVEDTGVMTAEPGQGIWVWGTRSLLPDMKGGSITGKMAYSVAFRPSATTKFPLITDVPKYAVFNTATPGFPSGFEVKIVGAGAARKVVLRLVLMSNFQASKYDSQEGFVISSS